MIIYKSFSILSKIHDNLQIFLNLVKNSIIIHKSFSQSCRGHYLSLWVMSFSVTVVVCPSPPNSTSSTDDRLSKRNPAGQFAYGTIVTYECLPGRRFDDGNTLRKISCDSSGSWTGEDLACEGEYSTDPVLHAGSSIRTIVWSIQLE